MRFERPRSSPTRPTVGIGAPAPDRPRCTDGSPVTLSAATFTDRDENGLIASVRLYVETTALYIRGG